MNESGKEVVEMGSSDSENIKEVLGYSSISVGFCC